MRGFKSKKLCLVENEHVSHVFLPKTQGGFCQSFLPCFWAGIDPLDTKHLKIDLLTIFAEGCKKHPEYRALRRATGECEHSV